MNSRTLRHLFQILLAALCALAFALPAQADPPGRVGRIAWMSGTVQLRNADSGEWNTAVLNWPLTNGDALSTGPGARLEIGIGSTTVRLDSSSELAIDQLDDERVRLYLVSGTAAVRLRSREAAREFELATSDGRFTAADVGAFRFDFEDNVSSATAYLGALHFESEDSALDIPSGQRAQFWYSGQTMYALSPPVRDDFSEWSMARDQRQDTREARRYVSPEMTGYEDLAGYGSWYDSTDYGPIWYPSVVVAGWAPYRHGHWAWVSPWGWTWIDDAPWGFAPFHYGRWVWHRDRWGWAPGKRVLRPVYAPALVAWVDTPGVSVGISSGPAVGWFPLAPREVYVPSYRCSPTYVRNVNITHVTHIENVTVNQIVSDPHRVVERTRFVNRHLPQAVTIVPADVVTHRRPVAPVAEQPRNPRLLETIAKQPALVQAPVTAPSLRDAARHEERRRDWRDERHDGRRERAPAQPQSPVDDRVIGTLPARPPAQVVRPRHATEDWPIGDPAPIRKPEAQPQRTQPVPPGRQDAERAPARGANVESRPQLRREAPAAPPAQPPGTRPRYATEDWPIGDPAPIGAQPTPPARRDADRMPGRGAAVEAQPQLRQERPAPPPAQVTRPRHATEDWPIGDPAPIQRPGNAPPRAVPTPRPEPRGGGAAIESRPVMRQPAPAAVSPAPPALPRAHPPAPPARNSRQDASDNKGLGQHPLFNPQRSSEH